MSQGKVVQIIGAVVDIDFPQESVPGIYDALNVTNGDLAGLVLEVQQQLGGGTVRAIALGSTDGLRRGTEVANTGKAIHVPVGKATLGRIMERAGRAISTKLAQSAKKSGCLFTVQHQATKTKPLLTPC